MTVLFDRLLDDAAIFPPGNAPMEDAVRAHAALLDGPDARHVGPFTCSASRLVGLGDALSAASVETIDVALVTTVGQATAAIARAHDDPRMHLRAVEISGSEPGVELPPVPEGTRVLLERAVTGSFGLPPEVALKLRTGGETADAFPDEKRLAAALDDAVGRGLRFKLTAGLHHAVRHTDASTGFEHHGFLNVMLAVHAAATGSDDDLAALLAERDPSTVASAISGLDEPARGLVRSHFLSFGTCSITDPVADLRRLGLLEDAA